MYQYHNGNKCIKISF